MKLHIFVIRDSATDSYGNPMFMVSSGQAVRGFTDAINKPDVDKMLFEHPDDFELFELGSFDTNTATFDVHQPVSVTTGKMVKIRS